ncbi:MAG TPA: hypothetical protein VMM14_07470 [Acidimicrobiia bacterium]|nr:hypothetical protein [Acidimicrobiia bacterium]
MEMPQHGGGIVTRAAPTEGIDIDQPDGTGAVGEDLGFVEVPVDGNELGLLLRCESIGEPGETV